VAKRKAGPTLFELMRRSEGRRPWWRSLQPGQPAGLADVPGTEQTDQGLQAVQVGPAIEKGDGLIVRLNPTQAALLVTAGVAALVLAFVAGRMTAGPGSAVPVARPPASAEVQSEKSVPLASLVPAAANERATPDSPRLEAARPAPAKADSGNAAAARAAVPGTRAGQGAGLQQPAAEDPRRIGLNYLVVQNFVPSAWQDAQEVKRFLASQGIETLVVRGRGGGWKVVSRQGFDLKTAAEKSRAERLRQAVRRAGQKYASARYRGRYDFADCYWEKYKGSR